jgi:hypothetical protein
MAKTTLLFVTASKGSLLWSSSGLRPPGAVTGEPAELEIRDDVSTPASTAPGAEPAPAPSKVVAQLP